MSRISSDIIATLIAARRELEATVDPSGRSDSEPEYGRLLAYTALSAFLGIGLALSEFEFHMTT